VAQQNIGSAALSLTDKRGAVEPGHPGLSLARQCALLGLSRASYYRGEPVAPDDADNQRLMRLIDEAYTRHPFYGSRKMTSWLRRQGDAVNRKRVRRLMRRMGPQSVAPKPCTSRPAPGHPVYPYLLRGLAIVQPHQVWCTVITYRRLAHGFVYLTAVMDWYSRYVLSW
jgi:putative transposase